MTHLESLEQAKYIKEQSIQFETNRKRLVQIVIDKYNLYGEDFYSHIMATVTVYPTSFNKFKNEN